MVEKHAASGRVPSNGPAIATMCLGVVFLVSNDALAKWLTQSYTPLEIMFVRSAFALPMITAVVLLVHGPGAFRSSHLGIHALRGTLSVGATYMFFLALSMLPLAEATALIFSAPIFITALSVPLLRQPVGWRRWAAVLVGFAGVLIIVRPGAATFQVAAVYAVLAAMIYALVMITARWIGRAESAWTMMFYMVLFPLLISGVLLAGDWPVPRLSELWLFLGLAVFGTLGVTLISQAFRLGDAAVVAPFDYTALLWASVIGWFVWGEVPSVWTYAGAAVIVASGIYIVAREARAGAPVH